MTILPWIQTASGQAFDYAGAARGKPQPVLLDDVATALSNLCRFTGHCRIFYSVAEHSVMVSHRARQLASWDGLRPELVRQAAQWGLLHDASEAYAGDVNRPLKHMDGMEAYRSIESACETQIIHAFLDAPPPDYIRKLVKIADNEALAVEKREIMRKGDREKDWEWLPEPPDGYVCLGWRPPLAKARFLSRAAELGITDRR